MGPRSVYEALKQPERGLRGEEEERWFFFFIAYVDPVLCKQIQVIIQLFFGLSLIHRGN